MKLVISLDWFQYFAYAPIGFNLLLNTFFQGVNPNPYGKRPVYEVCQAQEFHSIYRKSFTIKQSGFPICHLHFQPKSSALDPHSCAVKVANRLLYSSTWSYHVLNVCDSLGLQVKSITRADLCCDFVKFANDMLPSDFIHHYVRDKVDTDGTAYIRKGSNKYCVIGKKRMIGEGGIEKLSDTDTVEQVVSSFEYLRFGTRQSGVSVYLYNKSEELRAGHSKPWIRQSWIDNGLIPRELEEGATEPDVFRLELSIQAKGMTIKESKIAAPDFTKAENIRKLVTSDFETQRALEQTFWAYQAKYFTFRVSSGQHYRKDMPVLDLFEYTMSPTIKPTYLNRAQDTGVAERNAAGTLARLRYNTFLLTSSQLNTLMEAADILESVGVMKRELANNDTSWLQTDEGVIAASRRKKGAVEKMIEERLADMRAIFQVPEIQTALHEWEFQQQNLRDLYMTEREELYGPSLPPIPTGARERPKMPRKRNN